MLRKKPDYCTAVLIIAIFIVCLAVLAFAGSSGPNSPSNASTESGFLDEWSNPTNIYSSDNARAYYGNNGQKKLRAYDFGFSIPVDVVIDGFLVQVEGYASFNGSRNKINIALSKSSYTVEGSEKADALPVGSANEAYINLGGSSDKWGGNWLASDVNSGDFGVLIWDWDTSQDALHIDHIKVTVYYTTATGRRRKVIIEGD